jgi:hypothetical protein
VRRSLRRAGGALALVAAAAAASAPGFAQTPPDTRQPCERVLVAMDDSIDSAHAKSGDSFKFRLVDDAVSPDGTRLASGTLGYGVVAISSHADKGGRGGYLAIETRFFVTPDGKHVPAIIDRANDNAASAVGASANAPGVLGLIPIVGYAVGGYDAMHHGRDATIPRGTRVGVLIGDDAALGACRPLAAGESPPPMPTAAPTATPAPAASPAPGTSSSAPVTAPATIPTPPAPAASAVPTASPTMRP